MAAPSRTRVPHRQEQQQVGVNAGTGARMSITVYS